MKGHGVSMVPSVLRVGEHALLSKKAPTIGEPVAHLPLLLHAPAQHAADFAHRHMQLHARA